MDKVIEMVESDKFSEDEKKQLFLKLCGKMMGASSESENLSPTKLPPKQRTLDSWVVKSKNTQVTQPKSISTVQPEKTIHSSPKSGPCTSTKITSENVNLPGPCTSTKTSENVSDLISQHSSEESRDNNLSKYNLGEKKLVVLLEKLSPRVLDFAATEMTEEKKERLVRDTAVEVQNPVVSNLPCHLNDVKETSNKFVENIYINEHQLNNEKLKNTEESNLAKSNAMLEGSSKRTTRLSSSDSLPNDRKANVSESSNDECTNLESSEELTDELKKISFNEVDKNKKLTKIKGSKTLYKKKKQFKEENSNIEDVQLQSALDSELNSKFTHIESSIKQTVYNMSLTDDGMNGSIEDQEQNCENDILKEKNDNLKVSTSQTFKDTIEFVIQSESGPTKKYRKKANKELIQIKTVTSSVNSAPIDKTKCIESSLDEESDSSLVLSQSSLHNSINNNQRSLRSTKLPSNESPSSKNKLKNHDLDICDSDSESVESSGIKKINSSENDNNLKQDKIEPLKKSPKSRKTIYKKENVSVHNVQPQSTCESQINTDSNKMNSSSIANDSIDILSTKSQGQETDNNLNSDSTDLNTLTLQATNDIKGHFISSKTKTKLTIKKIKQMQNSVSSESAPLDSNQASCEESIDSSKRTLRNKKKISDDSSCHKENSNTGLIGTSSESCEKLADKHKEDNLTIEKKQDNIKSPKRSVRNRKKGKKDDNVVASKFKLESELNLECKASDKNELYSENTTKDVDESVPQEQPMEVTVNTKESLPPESRSKKKSKLVNNELNRKETSILSSEKVVIVDKNKYTEKNVTKKGISPSDLNHGNSENSNIDNKKIERSEKPSPYNKEELKISPTKNLSSGSESLKSKSCKILTDELLIINSTGNVKLNDIVSSKSSLRSGKKFQKVENDSVDNFSLQPTLELEFTNEPTNKVDSFNSKIICDENSENKGVTDLCLIDQTQKAEISPVDNNNDKLNPTLPVTSITKVTFLLPKTKPKKRSKKEVNKELKEMENTAITSESIDKRSVSSALSQDSSENSTDDSRGSLKSRKRTIKDSLCNTGKLKKRQARTLVLSDSESEGLNVAQENNSAVTDENLTLNKVKSSKKSLRNKNKCQSEENINMGECKLQSTQELEPSNKCTNEIYSSKRKTICNKRTIKKGLATNAICKEQDKDSNANLNTQTTQVSGFEKESFLQPKTKPKKKFRRIINKKKNIIESSSSENDSIIDKKLWSKSTDNESCSLPVLSQKSDGTCPSSQDTSESPPNKTENDARQTDYHAYSRLSKLCSAQGLVLDDIFRRKEFKDMIERYRNFPEGIVFIGTRTCTTTGKVEPIVHVHKSKTQLLDISATQLKKDTNLNTKDDVKK